MNIKRTATNPVQKALPLILLVSLLVNCDWLLTKDTNPPVVWFRSPANGALCRGMILLQVHATDSSGVVRVEFFVDSLPLGTGTPTGTPDDYEYLWNTTGLPLMSTHYLRARAIDLYDNVGYSETVQVTVIGANDVDVVHGSLSIPARETLFVGFNGQPGDSLVGDARVLAGATLSDFFWCDSLNLVRYRARQNFTPFDRYQNQTVLAVACPVPEAGKYYLVFHNAATSSRTVWVRFLLRRT